MPIIYGNFFNSRLSPRYKLGKPTIIFCFWYYNQNPVSAFCEQLMGICSNDVPYNNSPFRWILGNELFLHWLLRLSEYNFTAWHQSMRKWYAGALWRKLLIAWNDLKVCDVSNRWLRPKKIGGHAIIQERKSNYPSKRKIGNGCNGIAFQTIFHFIRINLTQRRKSPTIMGAPLVTQSGKRRLH